MKARCKKELGFPNFTFEVDKEYDFEVKVVYLPAEKSDCVLARGNRTRHLRYSTKIEVIPSTSILKEKIPITVHFHDRQYCIRNNWRTPGVKLVGLLPGGELYCFEDFFVESNMEDLVKNLRAIGNLPTHEEFWQKVMNNPLPRRFPNDAIDSFDVYCHASCGQQKRSGVEWSELTKGEPESHYKGEGKKAVNDEFGLKYIKED